MKMLKRFHVTVESPEQFQELIDASEGIIDFNYINRPLNIFSYPTGLYIENGAMKTFGSYIAKRNVNIKNLLKRLKEGAYNNVSI